MESSGWATPGADAQGVVRQEGNGAQCSGEMRWRVASFGRIGGMRCDKDGRREEWRRRNGMVRSRVARPDLAQCGVAGVASRDGAALGTAWSGAARQEWFGEMGSGPVWR